MQNTNLRNLTFFCCVKIFQGNRDRNSKVTNVFPQPITARLFRLVVETFQNSPSLRLEYVTLDCSSL